MSDLSQQNNESTVSMLSRCAGVSLLLGIFFLSTSAWAQMPGMEPPENAEPAADTVVKTPHSGTVSVAALQADGATETEQETPFLTRRWTRYMGADSPYRALILVILTLFVLLNLKAYLTRIMRKTLKEQAFLEENATSFIKVWNTLWKFIIAVLAIMAMSGSLRLLGLTAGFFGMMLGWSLQQPVTGIAAWLMIILKKPFRIGDRVIIAGITGDVTGISLTHVILNQVGGSVGGEERSGRGILIPNAILFQNVIINYTLDQEFMLDEVPVRLTFDSDWERAKEIMIAAASDVTKDIIATRPVHNRLFVLSSSTGAFSLACATIPLRPNGKSFRPTSLRYCYVSSAKSFQP
ncbi:MAG: mechanosensitive ion channel family protein [Planctomycetes bacterium]|nr:mechanosensitive ion channel family protein [Planctomycetota bacterium]